MIFNLIQSANSNLLLIFLHVEESQLRSLEKSFDFHVDALNITAQT